MAYTRRGTIALAAAFFLLAAELANGAGNKFELVSEKQLFAGGPVFAGALSPDGKSALMGVNTGLRIVMLESQQEKELLPVGSLPPISRWAAWSPDGKWVYYPKNTDKPWISDLWRIEAASLKTQLVIKNAAVSLHAPKPQPSPDGKSIAFFRDKSLLLAGTDGKNERVLWENCDPGWGNMAWSPDGSQILLPIGPSPYVKGFTNLSLVTVSTKEVKALTPWRGQVTSIVWPSWSSGAFLSARVIVLDGSKSGPAPCAIWYLDLSQNERTKITQEPGNYLQIAGVGSDGYSLVALRMAPPPGVIDTVLNFFAKAMSAPSYGTPPQTVLLTLKK